MIETHRELAITLTWRDRFRETLAGIDASPDPTLPPAKQAILRQAVAGELEVLDRQIDEYHARHPESFLTDAD